MLHRVLDDSYPDVVRNNVAAITATRLAANAAYRYAPPFLATIARGLDVELSDLGVALAVAELCGLSSPLIGRLVDRLPRRTSMVLGLIGTASGALLVSASRSALSFAVGLFALSLSKLVFDVAMGSWIAEHVPYERRGRVVGLTETSWALGLLIGVSSMGLVTAATSWRWGYVTGAAGVAAMAVFIFIRLDRTAPGGTAAAAPVGPATRLPATGWLAVVGVFGLMAGSQSLFVTFGAWLEDEFGITTAALAVVTFGLGALELVASSLSAARTDQWGKERSVIAGTMVMVPAAMVLSLFNTQLAIGLVLLGAFIAAFEFCIVSAIPIGSELVPGRPARGLGTMIAVGTLGRALSSVPATRLYDERGLSTPALVAAGCAALAGTAMAVRRRSLAMMAL